MIAAVFDCMVFLQAATNDRGPAFEDGKGGRTRFAVFPEDGKGGRTCFSVFPVVAGLTGG